MKNELILLLTFLNICTNVFCQHKNVGLKKLKIQPDSKFLIQGTSSLHDWESTIRIIHANILIDTSESFQIKVLKIKIKTLDLKSKKRHMDKLTHKALKAKTHPYISFLFTHCKIISKTDTLINLKIFGNLNIAGITKNISVSATGVVNKIKTAISLQGSYPLKMTDYNVIPWNSYKICYYFS
jgi:polyisoprenoid-binding protein YceI